MRLALAATVSGFALFVTAGAHAAPIAAAGFTLTTFATGTSIGASAPDSITSANGDIYVGYGNGGDPTGANGATSTIARYNANGQLLGTTTVAGHNDGLKYNAATGQIWAIQNEDANANVVLINPNNLTQSPAMSFSAATHGGGYDDVVFSPNGTFVSASNPANSPNTAPAIVGATISGGVVNVSPVLNGSAVATNINTGKPTTLNLQDPDSMTLTPNGSLALTSQADKQLVFVSNPGTAAQSVSVLNLTNQIDDTQFATGGLQTLLVADKGNNTVYALTGNFQAGAAYSAAAACTGGQDCVGLLNLTDGSLAPVISGLIGPGGEAFVNAISAVPEPATLTLLGAGIAGLAATRRHRRAAAAA
jgi:hypothetical protein